MIDYLLNYVKIQQMGFRANRAFDRCSVKVVEFHDFAFPPSIAGAEIVNDGDYVNLKDGTAVDRLLVKPGEQFDSYSAGCEAVLHCPRTEDERVNVASESSNHSTRLQALASLRELAGNLLCANCRYSSMTPIDLALERAALAKADAERAEALAELAKSRKEAIAELESTDIDFILRQRNQSQQ